MYEYDHDTIKMENEFETVKSDPSDASTSLPQLQEPYEKENRYYRETIKPKKAKGSFVKFVAVAVICALIGAPLLGLGMGAGQTIAESYLNKDKKEDARNLIPANQSVSDNMEKYSISGAARLETVSSLNSIVDIVKSAHPSVVNITTSVVNSNEFYRFYFGASPESQGSGTGIIFEQDDENVYIMTNYHVIQDASKAYISFDDNEQVQASPVGADKEEDIAVISVKKSDLAEKGITDVTVARLGKSSEVEVGELVVAIGNAVGNGKTVTYGIVSALNKEVSFEDGRQPVNLIQTDAAINKGNSGGALVNMNGEVIGMNTAKLSGYTIEGMGFAIPMDTISDTIDGIMNNKVTKRPFIGISGSTLTKDFAELNGLIVSEGVMLEDVIEGGGASDAGLRRGDIIIEFDGQEIKSIEELQQIIAAKEIGSKAGAKIIRNNERELEVIIVISNMADVNPW